MLGDVRFYQKFGFEPCAMPRCPFDKGNKNFLSIRNEGDEEYMVGYEPKFSVNINKKSNDNRRFRKK